VLFGQKVSQILTYQIAQTKSCLETRFDFLQWGSHCCWRCPCIIKIDNGFQKWWAILDRWSLVFDLYVLFTLLLFKEYFKINFIFKLFLCNRWAIFRNQIYRGLLIPKIEVRNAYKDVIFNRNRYRYREPGIETGIRKDIFRIYQIYQF